MTKILKSKYKQYKSDHVFDQRRKKIKLSWHRYNLRYWDRLEFLKWKKSMGLTPLVKKYKPWNQNFRLKQEIKSYYGNISDSTFHKYNNKKTKSNLLVSVFERRLDVILFRLHWARSIYQSKQLIAHGHILINGQTVDISSYLLNKGDIISISKKLSSWSLIKSNIYTNLAVITSFLKKSYKPHFLGGLRNLSNKLTYWTITPLYLEVDYKKMKAILVNLPDSDNLFLSHPINYMRSRKTRI